MFLVLIILCCLRSDVFGAMFADSARPLMETSILRPKLNDSMMNDPSWSRSSMTLTRKEMVYTYDNYTIDSIDHKTNRTRWLARRTLLTEHNERRALLLGSDQNKWTWRHAADSGGVLHIQLCYENQNSLTRIHSHMNDAIAIWHARLGDNSGIRFANYCLICQIRTKYVHVIYDPDARSSYSTLAAQGNGGLANHPTNFMMLEGPERYPQHYDNGDHEYVSMLVHELGHVLGLEHEQMRPDWEESGMGIDCTRIPNYEVMQKFLAENINRWPAGSRFEGNYITVKDACKYGELSIWYQPIASRWNGKIYIPRSLQPNGRDALGQPGPPRPHGAFDWGSVMLYPSTNAGYVHYRLRNGNTEWIEGPPPTHPSDGDVYAVQHMYPPIR